MSKLQILIKGLIRENPTFVLLLGMCPTLGTTTSALNGMGMGAATLFVLTLSNIVISMIKNVVPDKVRIPAFIVVIASFVTVVQLCMEAYMPDLYKTSKNGVLDSALDGLGIGLGFTLSLTLLGAVRELLGAGAIFGHKLIAGDGMLVFILAPGAFIALAYLMTIFNKLTAKHKQG